MNTTTYTTTRKFEPWTSQKSFYGKAEVDTIVAPDSAKVEVLYSYGTAVAALVMDKQGGVEVFRLWGGYSATTAKHIQSFHIASGLDFGGKKAWDKKPTVSLAAVRDYARNTAAAKRA